MFSADLDLTMVGLDVTHRALLSAETAEGLRQTGRAGAVVADLHAFYRRFHMQVYGHDSRQCTMPSPSPRWSARTCCAPSSCPWTSTRAGPARGRTIVDELRRTGPGHVHVALDVDADGFIALLCERIARLP